MLPSIIFLTFTFFCLFSTRLIIIVFFAHCCLFFISFVQQRYVILNRFPVHFCNFATSLIDFFFIYHTASRFSVVVLFQEARPSLIEFVIKASATSKVQSSSVSSVVTQYRCKWPAAAAVADDADKLLSEIAALSDNIPSDGAVAWQRLPSFHSPLMDAVEASFLDYVVRVLYDSIVGPIT